MSPSKVTDISWTTFHNVIDGQNRTADTFHQNTNPSTGQKNWDVPVATEKDVDEAVKAGERAFKSWSRVPIDERKAHLRRYGDLIQSYRSELSQLLEQETGKPPFGIQIELDSLAGLFAHHDTLSLPVEVVECEDKTITTRHMPLGVVGAICPWNFPLTLSLGKIIPAVLTGCTVIVKPSPFTPYSALKAVELAQQIFPPGVVQALGGDDRLGPWMTGHPGIAKISFTGSIATGKKIMAACAPTLKRVNLELGGNDASIVLPDIDIPSVAPQLVLGAFQNSGQVCVATKRIYIHEDIYAETLKAMADFAKSLKVGAPGEEGVALGPVQNQMQYERVKGFFDDVRSKGYKIAAGADNVPSGKGFFITPTIIDNPPNGSRIIEEEPFGPIVPTQPWSSEAEVIARANATDTGLGACVWGKDVARAERIATQLDAGSVWVNSFEKPDPRGIFGGHKQSGIGGGEWGTLGLLSYCNPQAVHVYK